MDEHATEQTDPVTAAEDRGAPPSDPAPEVAELSEAPEVPGGSAPSAASVEEFERLAVLRMGGGDIESAIDELPPEEAREVAEVAIDRVVRSYDHL